MASYLSWSFPTFPALEARTEKFPVFESFWKNTHKKIVDVMWHTSSSSPTLYVRVIKNPHKTFHFELNHKSRFATSAKNLVPIPFEQKHREQDFLIKKTQ